MTTRKENIVIPKEAYVIWGKLSAFEKYPEWRADASEIEMIDEKCFKESNREGYKTIFTIEKSVPLTCLKLCLENDSMTGYREFLLDSRGNETEIEITESVTSKRLSTRPIGKSVSERGLLTAGFRKNRGRFEEDLIVTVQDGVFPFPAKPNKKMPRPE